MLSHVLVLLLAWGAYFYIKQKHGAITHEQQHRVISLAGFASAVVMLVVTVSMIYETLYRFMDLQVEVSIEAFAVAFIGLVVNGLSAYFLHREEEKWDINMQAAYLHVLSDVVISLFAIVALIAAKYFDFKILDSILAIVGALVILRWAMGLIHKSWNEVLGRQST